MDEAESIFDQKHLRSKEEAIKKGPARCGAEVKGGNSVKEQKVFTPSSLPDGCKYTTSSNQNFDTQTAK